MKTITVPCVNFVSWSDPVDPEITHYQWYTPIHEIPPGINLRPNVRLQNKASKVYRTLRDAQLNRDAEEKFHNSYHLGSGGITILTKFLKSDKPRKPAFVTFANQGINGIVNGGHQYSAAMENSDIIGAMIEEGNAIDQYMPFHAITGIKAIKLNYIAKALNTNVQVTDAALLYSMGIFKEIEDVLKRAKLVDLFGMKGNEKAIKKLEYEISDNVVLMEAFNRERCPDGTKHPSKCASAKGTVITNYGRSEIRKQYAGMLYLLPQFWEFFETVARDGWDMIKVDLPPDQVTWVDGPKTHANGSPKPNAKPRAFKYPVTDTTGHTRLTKALTLSILSAFRQFLIVLPDGKYEWEISFSHILTIWEKLGPKMIKLANDKTEGGVGKASDTFKDDGKGVWTAMYKIVSDYRKRARI